MDRYIYIYMGVSGRTCQSRGVWAKWAGMRPGGCHNGSTFIMASAKNLLPKSL